jgi:hypothetical protein
VDINRAWETIRENIGISAKESVGCYEFISRRMLRIIGSKETSQIAMVTVSK